MYIIFLMLGFIDPPSEKVLVMRYDFICSIGYFAFCQCIIQLCLTFKSFLSLQGGMELRINLFIPLTAISFICTILSEISLAELCVKSFLSTCSRTACRFELLKEWTNCYAYLSFGSMLSQLLFFYCSLTLV